MAIAKGLRAGAIELEVHAASLVIPQYEACVQMYYYMGLWSSFASYTVQM